MSVVGYGAPVQIMPHTLFYIKFLYCYTFPVSISLSFFPFYFLFSSLSLYDDGKPPSSMQPASKCHSQRFELTDVSRVSSSFPPPSHINISLHLAELKFISPLAIYQKAQGWSIFPFCFHPMLVQGCHYKQLLKRCCGFPSHPQLPSHISRF